MSCDESEKIQVINIEQLQKKNFKKYYKIIQISCSITSIDTYFFNNYLSIESIYLPDSLTQIEDYAFFGCKNLKEIIIPKNVKKIGNYCFMGCINLNKVELPNCLKEIGESAFSNCSALTEIKIPENVVKINEYCFQGCSKLNNVILSEGVKKIKNYAFLMCYELKELFLPETIEYIGEKAFFGCELLQNDFINECYDLKLKLDIIYFENYVLTYPLEGTIIDMERSFLNFLDALSHDEIKNIKNSDIKVLINQYFSPCFKLEIDFSLFFHAIEIIINSDILEKQLTGIEILNLFIKEKENDYHFNQWIVNSPFLERFIEDVSINNELRKLSIPLYRYLGLHQILSIDLLDLMFESSLKAFKADKITYLNIITSCIYYFDQSTINIYINKYEKNEEILLAILFSNPPTSITKKIIQSLFKYSSKNFIISIINNNTRSYILDECIHFIDKRNDIDQIIIHIINKSSNPMLQIPEEIFNQILSYYEKNQGFVIKILKSFVLKTKQNLSKEILRILCKNQNDLLWEFLIDIINENGIKAFTLPGFSYMYDIFCAFDFSEATIMFIHCFYQFALLVLYERNELTANYKNKNTDLLPRSYTINVFPQFCLDIFIDLFLKNNNFDYRILYDFFTNISLQKYNEITSIFIHKFIPILSTDDTILKYRIINLMYKIVSYYDKYEILEDNCSKQRHLERLQDLFVIHIVCDGYKKDIHVSPNETCKNLSRRIQNIVHKDQSIYFNNKKLKKDEPITSIGIHNDSTIYIKKLTDIKPKLITSILYNNNFNKTCLNIIKSEKDEKILKITWKFLQLLPTVDDININFQKIKNDFHLKYYLQISLINKDFAQIDQIIDLFLTKEYQFSMFEFLKLFLVNTNNKLLLNNFKKIILILLDNLCDKDQSIAELSSKLIYKLTKQLDNADIQRFYNKYCNKIIGIIMNGNYIIKNYFIKTILKINNLSLLFEKVNEQINHIESIKSPKLFWKCFRYIYPSVSKNVDNEYIAKMLLINYENIRKSNILNILFSMCKVVQNKLLNKLIKLLVKDALTSDIKFQKHVFHVAKKFDQSIFYSLIQECLDKKLNIWNFNILQLRIPKTEFCGIVNLGSTCFLNSILQQLFYLYPFRSYIVSEEEDSLLKNHFIYLLTNKEKPLDMSKYISKWNRIIDTSHQQDACEFFQLFADKLDGECKRLFQGTFINHIISPNNESTNEENFYTIDLNVKDSNNIYESFSSFCEDEYIQVDSCNSIKYTKIIKAPPILVIHLKRFEYNLQTFERYKVNTVFTFPETLNIGPYLDKMESKVNYKLSGAVIHSGNSQFGHYFSLIKVNDKWIEFNDKDINPINEKELNELMFGTPHSNTNGYLLFYYKCDSEYDFQNVPDLSKYIHQDNYYLLFTEEVFNFMIDFPSEILLKYYINIFCHSNLESKNDIIIKELTDKLIKEKKSSYLRTFLENNFDDFFEIYLKCSSNDIISQLNYLIIGFLDSDWLKFVNRFFKKIKSIITVHCYKANLFLEIPYNFYKNNIDENIIDKWGSSILNMIYEIYDNNYKIDYGRVDISILIKLLKPFNCTKGEIRILLNYKPLIIQNKNNQNELANLLMRKKSILSDDTEN